MNYYENKENIEYERQLQQEVYNKNISVDQYQQQLKEYRLNLLKSSTLEKKVLESE